MECWRLLLGAGAGAGTGMDIFVKLNEHFRLRFNYLMQWISSCFDIIVNIFLISRKEKGEKKNKKIVVKTAAGLAKIV